MYRSLSIILAVIGLTVSADLSAKKNRELTHA